MEEERPMYDPTNPPEEWVQWTIAEWLDMHGILWCHVPNEGEHKVQYRRKQRILGVRAGVPDILIFDPPPARPEHRGVALELKRKEGGRLTPRQRWWLRELEARGWYAAVCYGIEEALRTLEALGYGDFRGRFAEPYPEAPSRRSTSRRGQGAGVGT